MIKYLLTSKKRFPLFMQNIKISKPKSLPPILPPKYPNILIYSFFNEFTLFLIIIYRLMLLLLLLIQNLLIIIPMPKLSLFLILQYC